MKYLKSKYEWALRPQCQSLLEDLVRLGLDRDLAFSVMESNLPEHVLYVLDEEDVSNE